MMNFDPISKGLISGGFFFILIGIIWSLGTKYVPLGKLPGDIFIEKENFKFYFPVTTSIALSAIFSGIFYLVRFITNKYK